MRQHRFGDLAGRSALELTPPLVVLVAVLSWVYTQERRQERDETSKTTGHVSHVSRELQNLSWLSVMRNGTQFIPQLKFSHSPSGWRMCVASMPCRRLHFKRGGVRMERGTDWR